MSKTLHLHYPAEYKTDEWRHNRLKVIARCLNSLVLEGLLLDIGCNDCSITRFLPVGDYHYFGIDLSLTALKEGAPHARIQGDACLLPLRDGVVDTVICSEVIEHLEDPNQLIEEIARVLKLQGKLVISTPNRKSVFLQVQKSLHMPKLHDWKYVASHFQAFSPPELDCLLKEHGFTIKKKAKSVAFPPFRFTKKHYPFKILRAISKAIPEDSQELLIRVAVKAG